MASNLEITDHIIIYVIQITIGTQLRGLQSSLK